MNPPTMPMAKAYQSTLGAPTDIPPMMPPPSGAGAGAPPPQPAQPSLPPPMPTPQGPTGLPPAQPTPAAPAGPQAAPQGPAGVPVVMEPQPDGSGRWTAKAPVGDIFLARIEPPKIPKSLMPAPAPKAPGQ